MGFDPTFAELAANPLPVGIECGRCLRRVLVDTAATLKPRKGDQRRLSQARLHCSRCGSREFAAQLFQTRAEATTFMKGYR
jgi:hypothetical protein